MELLRDPNTWIAFATLTALEIVLGIDNIIFISILASRLPPERRNAARLTGLALAMFTRSLLLLGLAWMMRLTAPLFVVIGEEISGRDIILMAGGLFLVANSTHEIHDKLEGHEGTPARRRRTPSFPMIILQILILDIVFSLDSVITAVGMVDEVNIMIAAVIAAIGVMMVFAGPIGRFVETHPTIKMLALSFLLLIGVMLIAEGFDQHIPRGYIYFAMAFSLLVEMLNLRAGAQEKQQMTGADGGGRVDLGQ
ncbi:MAG: TerC family protein [Gemmatimonadota bacterium]|jgi:predicted tellurium resistance membrane protein TerC|nr:TerC family protein [Gemmatimonadota bacterium]